MTRLQAGLTGLALGGTVHFAFGATPVVGGVVAVVCLVAAVALRERRSV